MIILSQVACTWKDVKKLKHEIEKKSSSTSVLFRSKLLQAADTLQVGAGLCLQFRAEKRSAQDSAHPL